MPFRRDKTRSGGATTTALVVYAEAPISNSTPGSNVGRSRVELAVDLATGPIATHRSFHLDKKRWLVAGMEVPITIDPSTPDQFEVDWNAIPSIEDRVAANDPTLADPLGSRAKALAAARARGLSPGVAEPSPDAREEFDRSMQRAAKEPAPPGKLHAVVLFSSIMSRINPNNVQTTVIGKSPAVLAVNVPGRPPYAVYEKALKVPRNALDLTGAGMPALVSTNDPADVEILWGDVPSIESQLEQRMAAGVQTMSSGIQAFMPQQAPTAPAAQPQPPAAADPGGFAPPPGMTPEMVQAMVQNAKRSLESVDPATRKMLIDQYRLAGIDISEDEEA